MKDKVRVFLTLAAMLTLLAACSAANKNKETKSSKQAEPSGLFQHLKQAKNELWYDIDDSSGDAAGIVDKNDKISAVWLFNKGKLQTYSVPDNLTVGELSSMTNKEILKKLPTWYEEAKKDWVDSLAGKDDQLSLETAQNYLGKNAKKQKLKVTVKTDSSGNLTISEKFSYTGADYWKIADTDSEKESKLAASKEFNRIVYSVVYDVKYIVFYHYEDGNSSDFLITRKKQTLTLDKPTPDGIYVERE